MIMPDDRKKIKLLKFYFVHVFSAKENDLWTRKGRTKMPNLEIITQRSREIVTDDLVVEFEPPAVH